MTDRPCPLDGAALPPGAVLCGGCLTRWRMDLAEVPELLRQLDLAITRQTSMPPASGVVRCADAACDHGPDASGCVQGVRLDLDVRASEASMALRTCLHGWVRVLDEEYPEPGSPPRPGASGSVRDYERRERLREAKAARDRALSSAAGRAGLLRTAPSASEWLPDAAREVRDAVREGWAAVDRPPDMQVVGRCPTAPCGRTLYAAEGSTLVRCAGCGGSWSRDEVRDASLAESRALATAAQLAVVLGIHDPDAPDRGPARIRQWARRGRLEVVRCNMQGQPLYRVAAAQALLRGETQEVVTGG